FYKEKHEKILDFVQKEKLLTPFLRTLLKSVHKIGLQFNNFFKNWHKTLILGINKDLNETYNYNLQKILEVLQTSVEVSKSGEIGDRSYSLPILIEGSYQAVAYADFFKEDFLEFKKVFEEVLIALEGIDEVCSKLEQKEFYLKYLRTLKKALLQHNIEELLESWREVDRAWMQITSPLQIGHPLEYYEDHFRRAVAPEWDLRIARIYQGKDLLVENSNHDGDVSLNKESMLDFYRYLSNQMPQTQFKTDIDSCVQRSLEQTQSYGGMPLLFYGSELNGLFSAQVIPNDESVSAEYGKKIFYFPDQVRELAYVKPFMRLSSKTFPQDFLDFNRELLYFRKEDWYKVYEITTIGHEFGHILWVGLDSELQMNRGGEFKNIEEFKATMGGLAYYFVRGNKRLLKEILFNTIARAVSSIALQRENEVLPYYCEGLIHLDILFTSGVLKYKGSFEQIALEIHQECLEDLVEHYLKIYYSLIRVYLEKIDAREFL
ncbi:MAG: invasion protein CiaB, partial [Helicobacter sp.]|nr:invasion protein CiaB [Helicobacter sp.]